MTSKKIIDTGLVEFILPFDRGEEKIYFNPNDIEFFIRLTDMINNISGMYDGLADEYEKTEDSLKNWKLSENLTAKLKMLLMWHLVTMLPIPYSSMFLRMA